MLKNVLTAREILPRKEGFESVMNAPEGLC
jgi:hypothetical protein